MWTEINWSPGVYKDDSPRKAEGFFVDADRIRFVRGLPQTFAGHEKFSGETFLGICRGLFPWADFTGSKYLFVGTHLRAYAYDLDGSKYDITPVDVARSDEGRGTLAAATTVSGDATVTLLFTSHGMVDDQAITLPGYSTANGVDISVGTFAATKVDDDTITIEGSSTATSTGTALTTVDYEVHIAPGQIDGISQLGYGTGPYGSGGYGSPTTGYVLYPRTYSAAQWGQNIVICPRGGSIYEWAPHVTAVELVTDGAFAGATAWTTGSSWSISSGVASATASASGNLTQTITVNQNAWHILDVDAVVNAGTCIATDGVSTVATINATATYKEPFYVNAGGSQTLTFINPGTFSGTLDNVSVKVLTTAHRVTNAPTSTYYIFTTTEGILVALGAADSNSNFDPLLVKWCDTWGGGGTNDFSALQTWTSTNANAAGDKRVSNGTRLVAGCAAGPVNLLWTDKALYTMTFVPDPSVVYRIDEVADSAGLIGPHAFTVQDGVVKWMSPDGAWYVYAGGAVQQLQNTCRRDVFDNIAKVQGDKVAASPISAWEDDIWFYPDSRDGNECSRYIMRNPGDVWAPGTFDRTAFIDAGVFNWPIAADTSGNLWFHEKGDSEDGGPFAWSLEGAFMGDGQGHITTNGCRPDAEGLKGGYCMTFTGSFRNTRGKFSKTIGPLDITSSTGQINFRLTAEDTKVKWSGNDAPTFWRMGQDRFDVIRSGRGR